MKELSTEQKAQKYDNNYKVYTELINRLEDVKGAIKNQNYGIAMDILCKPYPGFQITASTELKESEEDSIRKGIESIIKHYRDNGETVCPYPFVTIEKALAWLEKHGNG